VLTAYLPGLPEPARDGVVAQALTELVARLRRSDGSFVQDYVRMDALGHRP